MSSFDPDEFWAPKEDKRETVRRMFAKAGITPDGGEIIGGRPEPQGMNLRPIDERDGFFVPDGGERPISPTLAELVHYRPRSTRVDVPGSDEGELASLEESIRG